MQSLDACRLSVLPLTSLNSNGLAGDNISPLLPRDSSTESESRESRIADALDGERLRHDRAAAGDDLEIAHGATASALGGAGGEGAEGRGRGLLEERAKTTGLVQKRLHCDGSLEM